LASKPNNQLFPVVVSCLARAWLNASDGTRRQICTHDSEQNTIGFKVTITYKDIDETENADTLAWEAVLSNVGKGLKCTASA